MRRLRHDEDMELQTERLLLREYTMDDFAAVHSFASDVRIADFVDWGPNTTGETQEFLEMCVGAQRGASRTNFTLAVTFPGGYPFGSVGLAVDQGRGELGYVIDADHWGRGYATEAAASLLRFGKETLRLRDVTATCRPPLRRGCWKRWVWSRSDCGGRTKSFVGIGGILSSFQRSTPPGNARDGG